MQAAGSQSAVAGPIASFGSQRRTHCKLTPPGACSCQGETRNVCRCNEKQHCRGRQQQPPSPPPVPEQERRKRDDDDAMARCMSLRMVGGNSCDERIHLSFGLPNRDAKLESSNGAQKGEAPIL